MAAAPQPSPAGGDPAVADHLAAWPCLHTAGGGAGGGTHTDTQW